MDTFYMSYTEKISLKYDKSSFKKIFLAQETNFFCVGKILECQFPPTEENFFNICFIVFALCLKKNDILKRLDFRNEFIK